jgi:hypothetical protein
VTIITLVCPLIHDSHKGVLAHAAHAFQDLDGLRTTHLSIPAASTASHGTIPC